VQSTPESGGRAGYDSYKRKKGSKVHMAVDTLGHLLALHVTPANEPERDRVAILAERVQEVTGESVELADVDQGYTGDEPEADAASSGIHLQVVSLPEAKKGFVLLPRRWVVERSNGWMARFRHRAQGDRPMLRADRHGADGRDPVVAVPALDDGRLAPRGERAADSRAEHEPRLVEEHQVGLAPPRPADDPGHFLTPSVVDGGLVPLLARSLGLLAGPLQPPLEHLADVLGVEADAEMSLDQLGGPAGLHGDL
jgi:transposase